jgi:hypothetical protein
MRLHKHYYLPYRFKVLWGYKTQYKKHFESFTTQVRTFWEFARGKQARLFNTLILNHNMSETSCHFKTKLMKIDTTVILEYPTYLV